MNAVELLTHMGNFLLLPVFVAGVVALVARLFWYKTRSWLCLFMAGLVGSLCGLIAGWAVSGQDGHMLGYGLLVVLCSVFICVAGGGVNRP